MQTRKRIWAKISPSTLRLVVKEYLSRLDEVTELYNAVRQRHLFGIDLGLCAGLAKSLSTLLSIIPFQVTQTWTTHQACTWMTVGILAVSGSASWSALAAGRRVQSTISGSATSL